MAPRAARPAPDSQPLYEEDTESEAEQTPKAKRTGLKKRLSDIYHDDDDGGAPPRRAPLKAVNINDDAAEKRRRRKSRMPTAGEQSLPQVPMQQGQQPTAAAEGSRAARLKHLKSAAPAPAESIKVDMDNYEEWMKLATDNKINAANTWNFALIDYFHDMSLLRNTDDNSINFQRASCTLDGCVKIWTSRVDSVNTETNKLVSNLQGQKDVAIDEEDDGDASDNPDADPASQGKEKKKKKRSAGTTLAKDIEQLQTKKLDLEFSVDPLFKKTCADFDEGGAQGLLMNHLSLGLGTDGGMRVVFDASDLVLAIEEENEEVVAEPEERMDMSKLRAEFLPDLTILEDKAITSSLDNFSFSKAAERHDEPASLYAPDNQSLFGDDDDNEPFGAMDVDGGAPADGGEPVQDFFAGDDAIHEGDYGYNGGMWDGGGGGDDPSETRSHSGEADEDGSGSGGSAGPGGYVPFDPSKAPKSRDLILAMDEEGGGMMDYFDKNVLKNWAGPQHWKLRKPLKAVNTESATKKTQRKAKDKEAEKIDFFTPAEKSVKEMQAELFAPPGAKGASINMPKSRTKGKDKAAEDNTLPDDMHFSSKALITLFLKPQFKLRMRGKKVPDFDDLGEGEVDEKFWAEAAKQANAPNDGDDDDQFGTQNGGPIPFNTQFFNDDDDDGGAFGLGFDDPFPSTGELPEMSAAEGAIEEEQDLLAATEAGRKRKVRVESVNYSRRAKRVDVRKLKENIWKGLGIIVEKKEEEEEPRLDEDGDASPAPASARSKSKDEPPPTDPEEAKEFSSVISRLQQSYPKDKMDEISTSFCFICLLHLANEQGLKLRREQADGDEHDVMVEEVKEEEEDERRVGNIWGLKVYRDPDAFTGL